jgi:hypothetical protein
MILVFGTNCLGMRYAMRFASADRKHLGKTILVNDMVDPKNITDPGVRAQYAQALKEYEQNSDLVMRASELRKLADEFNGLALKYLVSAYNAAPNDDGQLRQYFTTYNVDPDTQKLVVDAIKSSRQQTSP